MNLGAKQIDFAFSSAKVALVKVFKLEITNGTMAAWSTYFYIILAVQFVSDKLLGTGWYTDLYQAVHSRQQEFQLLGTRVSKIMNPQAISLV